MSKLRSVNTHFWQDNYIIDLDPIEKLLFLYLLTNPQTNMLGIYELHIRRISFDTGIDKDMVLKIFDRFSRSNKAKYKSGYVILQNFIKHQSYNGNMETSAIKSWKELPLDIRKDTFCEPILKGLKAFTKGSEPIAEVEVESELEKESEERSRIPTLPQVSSYFFEKGSNKEESEKFYDYYKALGWKTKAGVEISDWKALIRNWLRRDEDNIQKSKVFTYKEMLNKVDKSHLTTDDFEMIEKDKWRVK